ncbi:MAG: hypothetical protein WBL68_15160, partial [Nitrososphaeraceae archaeon]
KNGILPGSLILIFRQDDLIMMSSFGIIIMTRDHTGVSIYHYCHYCHYFNSYSICNVGLISYFTNNNSNASTANGALYLDDLPLAVGVLA